MLFLEGVIKQERSQTKFKRVKAPSHSDMEGLVNTISRRIAQYLDLANTQGFSLTLINQKARAIMPVYCKTSGE